MALKPPINPQSSASSILDTIDGRLDDLEGGEGSLTVFTSPLDIMPKNLTEGGDNRATIQAAIDRITADDKKSGRIRLPEGIFPVSKAPSVARALSVPVGTRVQLEGATPHATLTVDENTCAIIFGPDDGSTVEGTPVSVTANLDLEDTQITVSSSSTFSVGQSCVLKSTVAFGSSTATSADHFEGEVVRIKTVDDATHVTVEGPLMFTYDTGNSPTLTPLTLTEGWAVRNLQFRNLDFDNTGSNNMGIRWAGGLEPYLENVRMRDMDGAGISLEDCVGFDINGLHLRDFNDDTGNGFYGYGVRLYGACSNGLVRGVTMRKGRHLVTTLGPDNGIAARHVKVADCWGTEMTAAVFDNHGGARYMSYIDCTAENSEFGLVTRSADTLVRGFTGRNLRGGISVRGGSAENHAIRTKLRDVTLENISGNYDALFCDADDLDVDGLHIDGVTWLRVSGDFHNAVQIDADRATIKRYTARNVLNTEKVAIEVTSGTGHYFDDIDVDDAFRAITAASAASMGMGRMRVQNVTTVFHATNTPTVTSPPILEGTGAPTLRAPLGALYRRLDSATVFYVQIGNTSGWGTTWAPLLTGVATQTYTATNVTTDRAYDANSTTTDELADVLGTLIADLRAKGLVA